MVLSGLGPTRTRPSVNIAAEGCHWEKSLARPEQLFWMVSDLLSCVPAFVLFAGNFHPDLVSVRGLVARQKPLIRSDSKTPRIGASSSVRYRG
jgi:hypothetical protein